jgi:antitoxin (DNA-binding transcriptional repressor) of toxin-antitoxin stability system
MKTMTISAFKAHISEELRKVRGGAHIIISDRDIPIAEVIPIDVKGKPAITVREPVSRPFEIALSPVRIDHDPVEYLLEDRHDR